MRLRVGVVDICLIPEVNFDVPALMAHARLLLQQKGHIVVRACSHVTLTPCRSACGVKIAGNISTSSF